MRYHILNGDSLAHSFPEANMEGEVIVAREGLIDGDLSGDTLMDFWKARAKYMGVPYKDYQDRVVTEFEKIMHTSPGAEFYLWFEYDLFCQVNMWFILSLINGLPSYRHVFAVYSSYLHKGDKNFWNGYGSATAGDLVFCFDHRIELNKADVEFGAGLWNAYKINDLEKLKRDSLRQSPSFPFIEEVIQAHIDRFPKDGQPGRPEKVLRYITGNISTDFNKVFSEFWKRESIYGFGDIQLKKIYDEMINQ